MPARLTAYPPQCAAERFTLSGDGLHLIGRADGCEVRLAHPSVSRQHASLTFAAGDWILIDNGSKNGSFIDGLSADGSRRQGGAWLRFGDIACELEIIDDATLARTRVESGQRRDAATALTLALGREPARADLLEATLDALIDLAGAERGILLLPEDGRLEPQAWRGFSGGSDAARFAGSTTALNQALRSMRPVVAHDLSLEPALAGQASVVAGGLRALACLPLVLGEEMLGLAYVDSRRPGAVITRIDLELLEAFAERAALWLAARRNQAALAAGAVGPQPGGGAG